MHPRTLKQRTHELVRKGQRVGLEASRSVLTPLGVRLRPTLRAFWFEQNLGDRLGPLVVDELLGTRSVWVPRMATGKFLGVGSIASQARADDVVWGSGLLDRQAWPLAPSVRVLAVRGPGTAAALGLGPEVPFGDPAILVPQLFPREHRPVPGRVGLVLHYSDRGPARPDPALHDLNVRWPLARFLDELVTCEQVWSSSLHGLILAEAYGLPATWVTARTDLSTFKFHDYYEGTGRDAPPRQVFDGALQGGEHPGAPVDLAPQASALADTLRAWWQARAASTSP